MFNPYTFIPFYYNGDSTFNEVLDEEHFTETLEGISDLIKVSK
jgi:hypothetical protein